MKRKEEKRTVRRFIFPGKKRRKNPTQKAYFIRTEREKGKKHLCVFKKNLCVFERRSLVIENDNSCIRC